MKTEDTPEIIEIIDDDIDAFGERSASTTMYDSGGPRWIGPVAAIVLIAIIGYGVASSASTSSVPRVAPAPSTTIGAPTTTHPAPTTTEVPKPLVPFYAATPPRQMTVEYAETMTPSDGYYIPGSYQLWATDGATAASGAWFSLLTYPTSVQNVSGIDAYRVQTDRMSMAISHLPGGQTSTLLSLDDSSSVSLLSFGLTDDAVVRLAGSLDVVRSHLQFTDRAVVEGYQLLSTVQPIVALQGNPAEQIFYSDSGDPAGGFGILVSPRTADADGSTLERQNALRFFLDNPTTFDVDGHIGTAGEVIGGQPGYTMATWIAGDHIVTVNGTLPVADLVNIAQTVHPISAEEWAGMQFQATRHGADNSFGNYKQTDPVPVSFGTDGAGQPWTVSVSIATFGDERQISWQWDNGGYGNRIVDTPTIETSVDNTRTYVLAALPRGIAGDAQLQVLRDGMDPVAVPFADTDSTFDHTFAAYAFSEPTTYSAQIIGPDGAVLASWPTR